MVCPKHPARSLPAEHPVTAALAQLSPQSVTLRLVTEPKEQARWNTLVRRHHYLKEHRLVGESLRYVAEQDGQWIALLGWSSAAFHLRPRDAWIGWTDGQRQARRHLLACNARFLILHAKARHPHLASHLLARNLERLSADWLQHYDHPLLLAETFVDPQRFEGTCYRAANWIQIGLTQGYARSRLDFYQLHAQPKVIFLYPLHPKARSLLSAPDLPPRLAPHERTPSPTTFPLKSGQSRSLLQALKPLRDPRRFGGKRHRQVASIVAIATTALIAGNNHLLAIGQFAQTLSQHQLCALGATRSRKTRQYLAPSETTLRRTLQRLDPDQLDTLVCDWLRSHLQDSDLAVLAVDGKCARTASKINGQSLTLFASLDLQTRQVRRQLQIPAKTNEIPALKDLLADLNLRGTLVTLDALHTQKETARFLVQDQQADYLLPVKANQPKLFNKLSRLALTGAVFPSGHHFEPGPRPT
jgi:hypothetical protein